MTDGREAVRPVSAPLRRRSRQRWAIAGGVAMCWLVADVMTHSAIAAAVLLVAIAGLGAATMAGLRSMGVTRDHPWLRQLASRPWRDGQDVLTAATRHLSDVFVITPSGSLLAPNIVEIQLNPGDLASLRERMELDIICMSATEAYEEQVAARGARFAGPGRPDVYVAPDDAVPPGRYRLRQGVPVSGGAPVSQHAADVWGVPDIPHATREFAHGARPDGVVTVMEQTRPMIPLLRLVTGSSMTTTSISGARAGRGSVELVLPDEPTISRVHALFTYASDRWWVSNQGRNGLCLNGIRVRDQQPLSGGDMIRWGTRPDAPESRIEIG
jgi:FHA domain